MLKNTLLILCTSLFFMACSQKPEILTHDLPKKEMIYSIKQAKQIDINELIKQIESYQIVFVGDHHNTQKTHKFFEDILKETSKKGFNISVANEWFYPNEDKLLKDYTDGKIDSKELKQKKDWEKFTKFKWEYVEGVYETVKKSGGKLYGMNIPKKDREKVSQRKFDEMSKEEKAFYDNLDLNVTAHKQLVMPYLSHCKDKDGAKEPCEQRMYRVQVTWDTYMAQSVNEIAKEVLKTPKDKLFVFVGAFHIENGVGIPLRFARLNNTPYTIISNERVGEDEFLQIDNSKADIVYIYNN